MRKRGDSEVVVSKHSSEVAPGGAEPDPRNRAASRDRQKLGLTCFLLGLLVVSFVLVPFGVLMVMASGSCFDGDRQLICSVLGQQLVAILPALGCASSAGIALGFGSVAIARRKPLAPRLMIATIPPVLCTVIALGIAVNHP